jgi:Superinfection immunity protein
MVADVLIQGLTLFLLLIIYIAFMFIPTYVAFYRRHEHRILIFAGNFFLGWTGIGWAALMIWALTEETMSAAPASARRG